MKFAIHDFEICKIINNLMLEMSMQLVVSTRSQNPFFDVTWRGNLLSIQSLNKTDCRIFVDVKDSAICGAIRDYSKHVDDWMIGNSIEEELCDVPNSICNIMHNDILPFLQISCQDKKAFFRRQIRQEPAITAVFWSEGSSFYSTHDNFEFLANGGRVLVDFNLTEEDYLQRLIDENNLTNEEVSLLKYLFYCKKQGASNIEESMKGIDTAFSSFFTFSESFYETTAQFLSNS